MSLTILLAIVWLHFLGDFVMQSDVMAINKSKSNVWLSFHVGVYCIPLMVLGPPFAVVNAALHWITDYFTSRATSKLYAAGKRHWFFVVIGLDQAIHLTCLIGTYEALT